MSAASLAPGYVYGTGASARSRAGDNSPNLPNPPSPSSAPNPPNPPTRSLTSPNSGRQHVPQSSHKVALNDRQPADHQKAGNYSNQPQMESSLYEDRWSKNQPDETATSPSDPASCGELNAAGERDDASETGTYTIGKDSPSLDEDQSRRDIDRVFGLLTDQVGAKTHSSADVDHRSTPNWIREWAAQVAQQQEAPLVHLVGVAKPPSAPPRMADVPNPRPRRRLPTVPPPNGCRSRSSPRPSDMSDPSDSSLETESFLRDTESVVSAMQVQFRIARASFFLITQKTHWTYNIFTGLAGTDRISDPCAHWLLFYNWID